MGRDTREGRELGLLAGAIDEAGRAPFLTCTGTAGVIAGTIIVIINAGAEWPNATSHYLSFKLKLDGQSKLCDSTTPVTGAGAFLYIHRSRKILHHIAVVGGLKIG